MSGSASSPSVPCLPQRRQSDLESRIDWKCQARGNQSSSQEDHISHPRSHKDKVEFLCQYCTQAFSLKNVLTRHEDRQHGNPSPGFADCILCEQAWYNPKRMMSHRPYCPILYIDGDGLRLPKEGWERNEQIKRWVRVSSSSSFPPQSLLSDSSNKDLSHSVSQNLRRSDVHQASHLRSSLPIPKVMNPQQTERRQKKLALRRTQTAPRGEEAAMYATEQTTLACQPPSDPSPSKPFSPSPFLPNPSKPFDICYFNQYQQSSNLKPPAHQQLNPYDHGLPTWQ